MLKAHLFQLLPLLLLLLLGCAPEQQETATATGKPASAPATSASQQPLPWKVPTQIPTGPEGDAIRRGEALLTQTAQYLGSES